MDTGDIYVYNDGLVYACSKPYTVAMPEHASATDMEEFMLAHNTMEKSTVHSFGELEVTRRAAAAADVAHVSVAIA